MIPYRAKNPPESFPYATIGLIAVNTLIYIFTSEYLLSAKEGVVKDWAISHDTFSPIRMVSSMFLHGSLMHLLGNMLFPFAARQLNQFAHGSPVRKRDLVFILEILGC